MPELDFALIADDVNVENGVAYVMRGAIDTVTAQTIPIGQNMGLLFRVTSHDRVLERSLAAPRTRT
jgi:hypothetical protein